MKNNKNETKNKKNEEIYSFKALSSSESENQKGIGDSRTSISIDQDNFNQNKKPSFLTSYPNKIRQGIYRHIKPQNQYKQQPELKPYNQFTFKKTRPDPIKIFHDYSTALNPKIAQLDSEIQVNIKRRMQLEAEVNRLKKVTDSNQKTFIGSSNQRSENTSNLSDFVVQKQFGLRNLQTQFVDQLVSKRGTINSKTKLHGRGSKINQKIQILKGDHLGTVLTNGFSQLSEQKKTSNFYDLSSFLKIDQPQTMQKKFKNPKTSENLFENPTPPPITAIQKLMNKLTFPQVPQENIQKLFKQCRQLYAIHQPHSDIIYMMMVGSFHLCNFHDVRKYFKEILRFKKFQIKAHWVAAQTQYILENFERCIKLTDLCMQNLDDKFLPRFLYLKAKCYYEQGNFTNSIVCYNQLIRIKSKIPEYYLERAILYDKLGYEKQCKEDYLMFGILKPEAKQYLQDKIIVEPNDAKRKELLQIYKRMV